MLCMCRLQTTEFTKYVVYIVTILDPTRVTERDFRISGSPQADKHI
jgi:hypothetical protein